MSALRPRYPWCWWCSRKLWGNRFRELHTVGGTVIVHASCADEMLKDGDATEVAN